MWRVSSPGFELLMIKDPESEVLGGLSTFISISYSIETDIWYVKGLEVSFSLSFNAELLSS